MTPRGYGPAVAHCPRCGDRLPGPAPTGCTGCGYQVFVNARPTAGLVVWDGVVEAPRFLAVRRAREPMAGRWELPGGFCDGWESPADAACREAREELGVQVALGDFVGMYVGSYDYQDESLPVLDCFFLARLAGGEVVLDPAEATELEWFQLRKPPTMAFPSMDSALVDALPQILRSGGLGFRNVGHFAVTDANT